MSQCPVPAVPEPPMLFLVNPEPLWTPAQMAEWERQLEAALGRPRNWELLPPGLGSP